MHKLIEVLLIEDNPGDARLIKELLADAGIPAFRIHHADRLSSGLRRLAQGGIDVLLLDLSLPDSAGLDTFTAAHAQARSLPIVVLTGLDDEELAAKAVRAGAQDYLPKGQVNSPLLVRSLRYAIERKRAQAEREGLLAQLDATFAAIPEGFILYDRAGTIVRMNSAAAKIFGYSEKELPKGSLAERVAMLRLQTVKGEVFLPEAMPVLRALEGEVVTNVEMVLRRSPQETIWISASAAPIRSPEGDVQGAVATFTDITGLHELLEQRADLVRTISHDLRSPLTVVTGYAQTLHEQGRQKEAKSAEAILKSSRRMGAMISDLVESVRMESGQLKLSRQPIDMPALVSEIIQRVGSAEDRRRLRLEILGQVTPVPADAERIERAIVNLITNALKYSQPETPVLIRVECEGDGVTLSVIDRGIGVPEEDIPHLFERFYRVKTPTKTEGLGLGLYIARQIVEAHGGRIWVDSPTAEHSGHSGSAFRFILPLQ